MTSYLDKVNAANWNAYRYIGDWLHLFGISLLLLHIYTRKSCQSISIKTQLLLFSVYCSRYIDLLWRSQSLYLVFFKISFLVISGFTCVLMKRHMSEEDKRYDTASVFGLIVISAILLIVIPDSHLHLSWQELLWKLSLFVEGVCMVPQYVLLYREPFDQTPETVNVYLSLIGMYRIFYALNWIYKKHLLTTHYTDYVSWTGGLIEILLFLDFVNYRIFRRQSCLRYAVIRLDNTVTAAQQSFELKLRRPSQLNAETSPILPV